MTEDDYLADVIQLPRSLNKAGNELDASMDELPTRTKREARGCFHNRAFINLEARTLTCRDCGVPIDPFVHLHWLAQNRESVIRAAHSWRHERDHLYEEVEKLKRQERNAKARIRSARRRRTDQAAIEAGARAAFEERAAISWDGVKGYARERSLAAARAVIEGYLAHLEDHGDAANSVR